MVQAHHGQQFFVCSATSCHSASDFLPFPPDLCQVALPSSCPPGRGEPHAGCVLLVTGWTCSESPATLSSGFCSQDRRKNKLPVLITRLCFLIRKAHLEFFCLAAVLQPPTYNMCPPLCELPWLLSSVQSDPERTDRILIYSYVK